MSSEGRRSGRSALCRLHLPESQTSPRPSTECAGSPSQLEHSAAVQCCGAAGFRRINLTLSQRMTSRQEHDSAILAVLLYAQYAISVGGIKIVSDR